MKSNDLLIEIDPLKGRIARADRNYERGELICRGMPISKTEIRTATSVQVSETEHVEVDDPARIFSHSCDWNMFIRNNQAGGYDFFACKRIARGDELTWNYGMTEAYSIAVPICHCGSAGCLGRSFGFKEAGIELRSRLIAGGVADYLLQWHFETLNQISVEI